MTTNPKSYNGVFLVNKPVGWTSHDVVAKLRGIISQRRIGHTGTLDPLASGLLVVCVGRATKIAQFLSGHDKTYEAEICLGMTSPTFDGEGITEDQTSAEIADLTTDQIESLLDNYRGTITQKVPAYSAVRVDGQRLHRLARKQVDVDLPQREVEIKELELLDYTKPLLRLRVSCSKGTYIRSLADDIGRDWGCGGYLAGLTRTTVGNFQLSDALTLEEVTKRHADGSLDESLLPFDRALHCGALTVTEDFRPGVLSGASLTRRDIAAVEGNFMAGDSVFLKDSEGEVLAIGKAMVAANSITDSAHNGNTLFDYIRVLN
jgi:tRNA pseudouridine55 synthase